MLNRAPHYAANSRIPQELFCITGFQGVLCWLFVETVPRIAVWRGEGAAKDLILEPNQQPNHQPFPRNVGGRVFRQSQAPS